MLHLLETSPIFLFAVVAAVGTLLGGVRVRGVSIGVAAVLFVGLAVSAWRPAARLPEEWPDLGVVIFVYAIGLASGPGFVAALRARGARDGLFTASVIVFAAGVSGVLGRFFLSPAQAAGVFAGALTNTPALAEIVQFLRDHGKAIAGYLDPSAPVVACSVAYPVGVLASLAAVQVALRSPRFAGSPSQRSTARLSLVETTVRLAGDDVVGRTLGELRHAIGANVSFGRVRFGGADAVADDDARAERGMLLSLIGDPDAVQRAVRQLGEPTPVNLALDRSVIDYRRIVVSRRERVGVPLGEIPLQERFGAHVTRVRRGDVDFVPSDTTTLQPGDRVRVVGPREEMGAVSKFFGDSIRVFGEVDMLTFGLGLSLGVVLGKVVVPLPGGLSFRLGLAGGPLVVGLVAGTLGRTGPLLWSLTGTANMTLRELGLLLFFAGVGTRSGAEFWRVAQTTEGLRLFAGGAVVSFAVTFGTLVAARRLLGMAGPALGGLIAGIQTQPAALAMAAGPDGDERANVAYATAYPVATVAKIVAAQILVRLLAR